ncbi:MAG: heme exporter protein CcmD [Alphaproteobacteria bacterium]|nr:heme exporter protein CcmD [Alphaproteobacteria bacterium]
MSADLADPHWLLIWPAYALTAAAFGWLVVVSVARLRKWSRAARALEAQDR